MKKVVAKRKDIVFYMKMFPLVNIHPKAYAKAKAIICEQSNEKSLKLLEDAYAKKPLPEASCKTDMVDRNLALGARIGISGTPALIFEDGRLVSGAISAEEIIRRVDR